MLPKARAVKRVGTAITAALLVLLFASVAQADMGQARLQEDPPMQVTLGGYTIELIDYSFSGDQSTWVYAVTVDPANLTGHGLSHWTLGICADCYGLTIPSGLPGEYTTLVDAAYCGTGSDYNCQETTYTALFGWDPTLEICGLKFEDAADQLSPENPVTHIFSFTITGTHVELGTIQVGIKKGSGEEDEIVREIAGPVCGSNAVDVACFNASSQVADPVSPSASPLVPIVAGAGAALTAGVLWLRRRVR